jgi:predicted nucleotidyltransferase
MNDAIKLDHEAIAEICKRYHVRKLSLFGSVLGEDFGPESDIDVLVEFEPGRTPGFFRLHEMEHTLMDLLGGRKVDLITKKFINSRIRQRILDQAQVIYAQE